MDLESLVGYIFLVLGRHSFNDVIEHFTSPPVREADMTIAEQLRKEGHQAGRLEGRVEGQRAIIRRVLELRFGGLGDDARRVIDVAGPEALDRLAERAVTAPSLGDALRELP